MSQPVRANAGKTVILYLKPWKRSSCELQMKVKLAIWSVWAADFNGRDKNRLSTWWRNILRRASLRLELVRHGRSFMTNDLLSATSASVTSSPAAQPPSLLNAPVLSGFIGCLDGWMVCLGWVRKAIFPKKLRINVNRDGFYMKFLTLATPTGSLHECINLQLFTAAGSWVKPI